jgi:hypothetical protein
MGHPLVRCREKVQAAITLGMKKAEPSFPLLVHLRAYFSSVELLTEEAEENSSWKGTASAVPQICHAPRGFSR